MFVQCLTYDIVCLHDVQSSCLHNNYVCNNYNSREEPNHDLYTLDITKKWVFFYICII